jgi:beta-lactamase superfamily II metal-dependent hydrolase
MSRQRPSRKSRPARRSGSLGRKTVSAGSVGAVEVRMYDVGFGDAFLLRFPDKQRTRKVLIDCGSIKKGSAPISAVARGLVAAAREDEPDGQPRIDVVIATHRHRDHVSGFSNAMWRKVDVGEVWMPWTEHPSDPKAKEVRDIQSSLAVALTASLRAAGEVKFQRVAENALSNATAMETLHRGFLHPEKVRRRFLPEDAEQRIVESEALPGLLVHVMGPARDSDVIRDMNPPAGSSYLRLRHSLDSSGDAPEAFRPEWWLASDRFSEEYRFLATLVPRPDRKRMRVPGQEFERGVAIALDYAVNGTSLMLAFETGRAILIFPGDAQWGTWNRAINDPEWNALLKRTSFYKVGHHGSHNATPRKFVELFEPRKSRDADPFWAMASVRPVQQWKSIPRGPLLEALRRRTRKVIRSDKPGEGAPIGFTRHAGYIRALVPL